MKTEFYADPREVFSDESLKLLALMVVKDNRERIFPNTLLEVAVGMEISKNNVDAFGYFYCTLSFAENNQESIEFQCIGVQFLTSCQTRKKLNPICEHFKIYTTLLTLIKSFFCVFWCNAQNLC
jgi:hypothetical protein